jgi:hypothetical protein
LGLEHKDWRWNTKTNAAESSEIAKKHSGIGYD